MKTVSFTDFRKNPSGFIAEIEQGETIVLLRHGKPVAEVSPFAGTLAVLPAWKQTRTPLRLPSGDLSSAILAERESVG